MAIYTPDWEYQKGKEALEELEHPLKAEILHYIKVKDDYAKDLQKRIDEMQAIFNGIRKFTKF